MGWDHNSACCGHYVSILWALDVGCAWFCFGTQSKMGTYCACFQVTAGFDTADDSGRVEKT